MRFYEFNNVSMDSVGEGGEEIVLPGSNNQFLKSSLP
jgi:hypothetical protein